MKRRRFLGLATLGTAGVAAGVVDLEPSTPYEAVGNMLEARGFVPVWGAEGSEWLPLSRADAEFLERREFEIQQVAETFGVPPRMLGSLEPVGESPAAAFRRYVVRPTARLLEEQRRRS